MHLLSVQSVIKYRRGGGKWQRLDPQPDEQRPDSAGVVECGGAPSVSLLRVVHLQHEAEGEGN